MNNEIRMIIMAGKKALRSVIRIIILTILLLLAWQQLAWQQ
jgi:hypothetical protein